MIKSGAYDSPRARGRGYKSPKGKKNSLRAQSTHLACGSSRDFTASDAKPIKFFYTVADGTLHRRKSSPVVPLLEYRLLRFHRTVVVVFRYAIQQWNLTKALLTAADISGLCMTKKLPTGVLMDGVVIPWSNGQSSLSSIPQYHQYCDLASPRAPQISLPQQTFYDGKASHRRTNGWRCDPMAKRCEFAEHPQYHQNSNLGLPSPAAPSISLPLQTFYDQKAFHWCINGWRCDLMVQ